MNQSGIIVTTIALLFTSQFVTAGEITDTYTTGETLTTTTLDNIKTAVNDNNTKVNAAGDITGVTAGSGLTGGGLSGPVTVSVGNGAITGSHIAGSTITGSDIASSSVPSGDLSNEAGIEFLQRSGIGVITNVPVTWTSIATLTVSVPSAGLVNCVGTGSVDVDDSASTSFVYVGWDMNNSTAGVAPDSYIAINQTAGINDFTPYSSMHTYIVSAGVHTFSFKIETAGSDATDFDIYENSYACMFFPTRY